VVTLRGVVQNEERRVRLEALSRAVSRGFSVANEITVCTPESPTAPESCRDPRRRGRRPPRRHDARRTGAMRSSRFPTSRLLLLAGDLTRVGSSERRRRWRAALELVSIPIFAVLGNHDYHDGQRGELSACSPSAACACSRATPRRSRRRGARIGIAGAKGFGGGFANACGGDFGEPEMKAFIRHTAEVSASLRRALERLDADLRVALLHYAPIPETLHGENFQIYPFSAATCSARPSTRPAPTSCCTGTRTRERARGHAGRDLRAQRRPAGDRLGLSDLLPERAR
jgi:hypothetical protein